MTTENTKLKLEDYKEFMSLVEVADYLEVCIDSIYNYINKGGAPLPSMRISKRKILIKKEDLLNKLFVGKNITNFQDLERETIINTKFLYDVYNKSLKKPTLWPIFHQTHQ